MTGIVNVLKPPGMTSFDVVAYLRGIFKTKKVGHTGTLDPGAAGVLPVCVGSAVKAVEYLSEKRKTYRTELTLGITTNTQDSSGVVTGVREAACSTEEIVGAIASFTGRYLQVPPMFSAVRIGGKKLYEIARKGKTVERKPREVEIYSTVVRKITGGNRVLFDVVCSKGTYIRTLCADIGERLGCGAHMSFLVRTGVGRFDIESAWTLEDIDRLFAEGRLEECLTGVDRIFDEYAALTVTAREAEKLANGASIEQTASGPGHTGMVRVYDDRGNFIALGVIKRAQDRMFLKSGKMFL